MADLNKESMAIWKSLKPMIDEEIKAQTRGSVQRRKMKVTTAPSLVTNVIGVTEPYGTEMLIPFNTNLSAANVGDVVWVEFMYGATNAFASMYASADTKDWTVGGTLGVTGNTTLGGDLSVAGDESVTGDLTVSGDTTLNGVLDVTKRRCSATLSSAGWYRLMKYEAANASDVIGLTAFVVDFSLLRRYANNPNEAHKISLFANYNSIEFLNEVSKSLSVGIDKIRYTYNGTNGYVDIHYSLSASNFVSCDFTVHAPMYQRRFTVESLQSVADAPAGETVLTTYTFNKNNGNPLVFKSQYYASASLYNASGSFINELRWQENEDGSIWILNGYATLTVTARNGANPGLTINLPSTFKGQSAQYRVGSQTQYQKEHLYLQLTNGSSTCLLRTSESWNNLSTGEVRFYVYQTIIFNR